MKFKSKLPDLEITIFSVMTQLAIEHGAINLSQGFPDFDTLRAPSQCGGQEFDPPQVHH